MGKTVWVTSQVEEILYVPDSKVEDVENEVVKCEVETKTEAANYCVEEKRPEEKEEEKEEEKQQRQKQPQQQRQPEAAVASRRVLRKVKPAETPAKEPKEAVREDWEAAPDADSSTEAAKRTKTAAVEEAEIPLVSFLEELLEPEDAEELAKSPVLQEASVESLRLTLNFLEEELQPGRAAWSSPVQRDPRLLATPVDVLNDALVWLEEFGWNQDWAVGLGRQALSTHIRHCPALLYGGVEALEETVAWLERHGVNDACVKQYVAGPTAVPYPLEPYPWIALFQAGADRLEDGARWLEADLNWSRDKVAEAIRGEPYIILAAVSAAGSFAGPPHPGYPLPSPRETWLSTQVAELDA